jgi:hypothetical protein
MLLLPTPVIWVDTTAGGQIEEILQFYETEQKTPPGPAAVQ